MKSFVLIFTILFSTLAEAQYAPQQGLVGSTAIKDTDPSFTAWASGCRLSRGLICADTPSNGVTTYGDSTLAIGAPDHFVVSLGDSGVALLTFPGGIYDGPGADFAVFENGFKNAANDSQAFLELAFVEVSSDGISFVRFPAQSLTPTGTQIPGSGVYMYANLINNLAGKYVSGYGTPFDLHELAGLPGLDVNKITHVKLIDVTGKVNGLHASRDSAGRVINDPYPTNFGTGGFDLDAVGVIHHYGDLGISNTQAALGFSISPNPAKDNIRVMFNDYHKNVHVVITSTMGIVVAQLETNGKSFEVDCSGYSAGLYYLFIEDENNHKCVEKFVKY